MEFQNLTSRSILPVHHSLISPPKSFRSLDNETRRRDILQLPGGANDVPDIHNVQGDVFYAFPKVAETFLFFSINDVTKFKADLAKFKPTTAYDVREILKAIDAAKATAKATGNPVQHVDATLTQIAFSRAGLNALGINEPTRDTRFDKGPQYTDRKELGDQGQWVPQFASGAAHGVFMLATSTTSLRKKLVEQTEAAFKSSITVVLREEGNVLPNRAEHFGYRDGISQPALRGLVQPNPGQLVVDPGVVVMGYRGDRVLDDSKIPVAAKRPSWTKDGTMMVFRKLEQDVEGFNKYLKDHVSKGRSFAPQEALTDKEASDLFGARLIGRWKSGAPIQLAPRRDDPTLGKDNKRNNNFDYSVPGVTGPSDRFCPFIAHTRKVAPRNLEPYISKKALEAACIVRTGIPYGKLWMPSTRNETRGLLFVCYQSSIDGGFMELTRRGGNNYFPQASLQQQYQGQDPIIGSPDPNLTGSDVPQYFVTSRGGEYLFVPSISTLQHWATDGHPPALDLLFLQDTTGSQQPYINAAEKGIEDTVNKLAASGNWVKKDLRFGLVAFRDHAPQDSSFATKPYAFTSDVGQMKSYLGGLQAAGGGDGPEAQTAALYDALNASWRNDAVKIVVLITDAPPHGLGESGDGFPNGDPNGRDPLQIARSMLNLGITLHVVACEPTLSSAYDRALDFYRSLADATHGALIGLSQADNLVELISHHALEDISREKALRQYQPEIVKQYFVDGKDLEQVKRDLHIKMNQDGTHIHTCVVENIYLPSPEGEANFNTWRNAKSIAEGKKSIVPVTGPRIKYDFRQGGKQKLEMKHQPVSARQAERIVLQGVGRYADVGPGHKYGRD